MADAAMIARLAGFSELAELRKHFDEKQEKETWELGRQLIANPEGHDRLEAERLRAYYKGVHDALALPQKMKATLERKEKL